MPAADLGPKVEQAVPRVDLTASKGEAVGLREVHARLARDGDSVSGGPRQLPLARPEEAGGIREGRDRSAEARLELPLRVLDLRAPLAGRRRRGGSDG